MVVRVVGKAYGMRVVGKAYDMRVVGKAYDMRVVGKAYDMRVLDKAYDMRVVGKAYDMKVVGKVYDKPHFSAQHGLLLNFTPHLLILTSSSSHVRYGRLTSLPGTAASASTLSKLSCAYKPKK